MKLTKEILEEYNQSVNRMKILDRKLNYYTRHITKSEHGVVKGSMTEHPYAEKHFVLSGSDVKSDDMRQEKIRQTIIDVSEEKERCEQLNIDIALALENIPNKEIGSILFMKYVENMTDNDIAEELGYERSTITKKINAFFKENEA